MGADQGAHIEGLIQPLDPQFVENVILLAPPTEEAIAETGASDQPTPA